MPPVFPGEKDEDYYRSHAGDYRRCTSPEYENNFDTPPGYRRRGIALITGSSRGIGYALVERFLLVRWGVIPCARHPDKLAVLPALLEPFHIPMYQLDMNDPASIEQLARDLEGVRIDLLINNAGVMKPGVQNLELTDFDAWEESFRVNTIGPFRLARALLPNLALGNRPVIANISSQMGSLADNTSGGYYAYRSSKAALNMVTRSLAHDLASRGIIVVALHPGWIRTQMGGKDAPMGPNEASDNLLTVIENLTPADSGSFINYDGARLPW